MKKHSKFLTIIVVLALLSIAAVSQGTEKWVELILAVVIGWFGMRPMSWLKNKLGLSDVGAYLALLAFSGAVAAAAMAISGQLFEYTFAWDNLIKIGETFFLAANLAYIRSKAN